MTNPGSHSDSGGRTETFSAESFFASQPVPATLEEDLKRVEAFLQFQASQGRRVVLITVRFFPCTRTGDTADLKIVNNRAEGQLFH